MDDLDYKAIRYLMEQGRCTWAELAAVLGLSAPATADRVHRLEESGAIKGYVALIDPDSVNCSLTAFISTSLERPEHRALFLEQIQAFPEIQECHHVAGDDDFLLKVRCRSTHHLDWLLSERIKAIPGVTRTRTTIVLSTVKETPTLPIFSSQEEK